VSHTYRQRAPLGRLPMRLPCSHLRRCSRCSLLAESLGTSASAAFLRPALTGTKFSFACSNCSIVICAAAAAAADPSPAGLLMLCASAAGAGCCCCCCCGWSAISSCASSCCPALPHSCCCYCYYCCCCCDCCYCCFDDGNERRFSGRSSYNRIVGNAGVLRVLPPALEGPAHPGQDVHWVRGGACACAHACSPVLCAC